MDAAIFTPSCTASAANVTLVDDQSAATGTTIAFAPAFNPSACGTVGSWFNFATNGGTINPTPFAFSPLPAGIPAEAGVMTPDATTGPDAAATPDGSGATDAAGDGDAVATGDGASSTDGASSSDGSSEAAPPAITGPKAACMSGVTIATQYSTSGMGFNLAQVMNPDGGTALPATVDASSHTGIQFWAWGGSDVGATSVFVVLKDINQTFGFGPAGTKTASGTLCDGGTDGNGVGPNACGGDRASETINPGWQLVTIPFSSFATINGYDTANETGLDAKTLTQFQLQVQEPAAMADAGVPYDLCIYGISFY